MAEGPELGLDWRDVMVGAGGGIMWLLVIKNAGRSKGLGAVVEGAKAGLTL